MDPRSAQPEIERSPVPVELQDPSRGRLHVHLVRAVVDPAGALVGALYASGYDVPELLGEILAMGLDTLIGRYGPATPPSLGDRRAILAWEGGARGFALQTNVVREAPLNALMAALYLRGNLIARFYDVSGGAVRIGRAGASEG